VHMAVCQSLLDWLCPSLLEVVHVAECPSLFEAVHKVTCPTLLEGVHVHDRGRNQKYDMVSETLTLKLGCEN